MVEHRETRLLPHDCAALFDLVCDIERYPQFVPGYVRAQVLQRSDGYLRVEQAIGIGAAVITFHSEAELQRPGRITIHAADGPFKRLVVEWQFTPVGSHCRVEFCVAYQLHGVLAPLVSAWLKLTAPRLLDAFVQRAAGTV